MAPRKKATPVKTEFDPKFVAHGVTDADLIEARSKGYSVAYLYETKGLSLDEWQKVWFAFRASSESDMAETMKRAVETGNARNFKRVEF